MNIKQLEVFVAIVESGNFSRAAEVLKIGQSTASQHIAALEESCGVKLLDRMGRSILPTEAGKVLLENARPILASLRKTQLELRQFIHSEGVELKIGGSTIPCAYIVPGILKRLCDGYPTLKIRTWHGDSQEMLEMLLDETVEVAVVGSLSDHDSLSFQPLVRDCIRLVVGSTHPWAGRESVTLEELVQEPLLLREEGSGTGKATCEALGRAGVQLEKLKVRARLGSSEAVKQAAVLGIGVAFVSELAIRSEAALGELCTVNVAGLSIVRDFYLVSRRGRELSPAAQAFSREALAR